MRDFRTKISLGQFDKANCYLIKNQWGWQIVGDELFVRGFAEVERFCYSIIFVRLLNKGIFINTYFNYKTVLKAYRSEAAQKFLALLE